MIGKRTREALYVHVSAWKRLPDDLRRKAGVALTKMLVYFGTGQGGIAWFGKLAAVENAVLDDCRDFLVKLPHKGSRVSFLYYPDFDTKAHPALVASILVDGNKVRVRSYAHSANPPILHRKEEFVAEDYPLYRKFAALTRREETCGLYAKATLNLIGTREGWKRATQKPGAGVNHGT